MTWQNLLSLFISGMVFGIILSGAIRSWPYRKKTKKVDDEHASSEAWIESERERLRRLAAVRPPPVTVADMFGQPRAFCPSCGLPVRQEGEGAGLCDFCDQIDVIRS